MLTGMSVSVYIRGLIVVKKMRARTLGSVSRWLKKEARVKDLTRASGRSRPKEKRTAPFSRRSSLRLEPRESAAAG